MNNDINILKKRLIYRSQYRGTKEMDKLIGSFVENNIDKLWSSDAYQNLRTMHLEKKRASIKPCNACTVV